MSDKAVFLTIAGSDPCGGAGIQADIKTADRIGLYPCTVVTAITAQNSRGVRSIREVEISDIVSQLECVLSDFRPVAVKVGMLCSADAVKAVSEVLGGFEAADIVVDPVLSPTLMDRKPDRILVEALAEKLFPLATLVTPNLPEKNTVESILGEPMEAFCNAFLLKGGHEDAEHPSGECIDVLFYRESGVLPMPSTAFPTLNFSHSSIFNQDSILPLPEATEGGWISKEFAHRRLPTSNTHGSGCVLSSAIACYLAKYGNLADAVRSGIRFIQNALAHSADCHLTCGSYGPSLI